MNISAGGVGARLETAIIFTRRMTELAAWYQQAFALGEFNQSPGHLGQQVGTVYLGFDDDPAAEETGRTTVSLWFTVDDLQATFARIVAMGAVVRYAPVRKPWGAALACVYDPDSNIVGLPQRQAKPEAL